MVFPSTHIAQPSGSRVYIFGSALSYGAFAHDLDVLFVYDRHAVSPHAIYGTVRPFAAELSRVSGLPVHPTVLTEEEEVAESFIERLYCIPLHDWLKRAAPQRG
jgi:predicted nucleotidyltransferase